MRKQEKIIVWPAYFDATKTRKNGRRVARNLAVPLPRISEIKDAAEKINLKSEVVDCAYPRTAWQKTGMLVVKKKKSKDNTIREIAKQLVKTRSVPTAQQKQS